MPSLQVSDLSDVTAEEGDLSSLSNITGSWSSRHKAMTSPRVMDGSQNPQGSSSERNELNGLNVYLEEQPMDLPLLDGTSTPENISVENKFEISFNNNVASLNANTPHVQKSEESETFNFDEVMSTILDGASGKHAVPLDNKWLNLDESMSENLKSTDFIQHNLGDEIGTLGRSEQYTVSNSDQYRPADSGVADETVKQVLSTDQNYSKTEDSVEHEASSLYEEQASLYDDDS